MDIADTPVALPLPAELNRCLAHGFRQGEWCPRRYQCACHETIKHDHGIHAPAAYRKCSTEAFAAFIPVAGVDGSTSHVVDYSQP